MQKLDRLGWADGFTFDAYGVLFGVRATNASILDRLRDALPFGWQPSAESEVEWLYSFVAAGPQPNGRMRRLNIVYTDALEISRTTKLEDAVAAFERDVSLMVGERARTRVLVHAGVVAVDGRAVVLPGRTLAGKSTLVAELVRAGATYYSDEFAVIDEDGLVHPFARPLSLRPHATARGEKVRAADLGGTTGEDPVPVAAVVVTSFRENARWRPRPLTPGKCTLELLKNALSARYSPDFVLPTLARVAEGAAAYATRRGEARDAARRILDLVAAKP